MPEGYSVKKGSQGRPLEKLPFEQRSVGGDKTSPGNIQRKSDPGSRNSKGKGPEMGSG